MNYGENIAQTTLELMEKDPKILILGPGVADPKGIFGTTLKASQKYPDRVIETPVSENMLTGACLGLAIEGWKPIFVHARCDFVMVTMEHIVNTVSKWKSVHQGKGFSMVIRALVGRGWGQGPNHSQALHAMFAQVPGLRVLYPVDPQQVSYYLNEAIYCEEPTIILEPRRVYDLDELEYPTWDTPDIFIATFGDVVIDAAKIASALEHSGVKIQVYPIQDVSNMQIPSKTAPVIVADTGLLFCGSAAELTAQLSENGNSQVKRIGPKFDTLPTSLPLESDWYPDTHDINKAVCELLNIETHFESRADQNLFTGPF